MRPRIAICQVVFVAMLFTSRCHGDLFFTGIGGLPDGSVVASTGDGLSSDGTTVVGAALGANGFEAYRWTRAGGIQRMGFLLPQLRDPRSRAYGVSRDGSVVTGEGDSRFQIISLKPFRWTEATGIQHVARPPGVNYSGFARDIDDAGLRIVGRSSSPNTPSGSAEGFLWTEADGWQGLGSLSGGRFFSEARGISGDGQTVVGYAESSNGSEAFRWTQAGGMQGLGDLAGGSFSSFAEDVSEDGSAIVGFGQSANGTEAFRWTAAGGMQGLGDLAGGTFSSTAFATSADGSVVVGIANDADGQEGFIWDAVHGMRSMQDVLNAAGLDTTGWQIHQVFGVSADGMTFAGTGINPSGRPEGWYASLAVTAIPEPSSASMLGVVSCTLMFLRRRRSRL